MSRRHRSVAASLAAFALVYAQFAVSAHACVSHEQQVRTEVMAHHEGCAGATETDHTPVNGTVCDSHCQYGNASVDSTQPVPAAVDSAGPALRVERGEAVPSADARPAWRYAPAAAPPPPAILFGVLRI
jgi:hypothetical protein